MSETLADRNEIPAALPFVETDEKREKLLREAAGENIAADENLLNEAEDEDSETLEQTAKPSKKKLLMALAGVILGFSFLVLIMCWFFGMGAFAAPKTQAVDRTRQTGSPNTSAPVTEDEKLKMALNLVAEKNPQADSNSPVNASENENVVTNSNSSVDLPPTKAGDLNEPVIIPETPAETNRKSPNSVSVANDQPQPKSSLNSTEKPTVLSVNDANGTENRSKPSNETAPQGRSLFFGIERKEKVPVNSASVFNNQTAPANQNTESMIISPKIISPMNIPFGTLLPIRLLGAVYTLRASGGLVRMELTRSVSGKNYSYPAGTVLVGTLRGSEYARAFISIVGLIDPATARLVKFEGEVMGNDGASGINGRRRQVKGIWSRLFGGLAQAGSVAAGVIGNRRSGGTVVISDSTRQASGVVSEELSGLIGTNRNSNEFVEIGAGTTGIVLVTDLPDQVSATERSGQNSKTATGLGTSELADLLTEGNPEKIRAALPRMTPAFRQLAEKALAMDDK